MNIENDIPLDTYHSSTANTSGFSEPIDGYTYTWMKMDDVSTVVVYE